MKMFESEAMKVSYLNNVSFYKCGAINKEELQKAKDDRTVDRQFLDFRRYATDPPLFDFSRFIPHTKKRPATTAPVI